MRHPIRERLTYANVVSTLALFLAIGGGMAFALASNSVKSRHIKNGQVKTADLKNLAVNSAKLGNGAVISAKLGNGAVTGSKLSPDAVAAPEEATLAGLVNGFNNCANAGVDDVWIDQSPEVNREAGWLVEPTGIVHLQGVVRRCATAGETIFTLPDGTTPSQRLHFASMTEAGDPQTIEVDGDQVMAPGAPIDTGIFLDGLSFRAG